MASVLGNQIQFFQDLGIYDVVLPFLLTFTIVFAVLERSRVLGTEKDAKGNEVTRKSINAMAAFVIGFLVVGSSKLVGTLIHVSSNIIILVLLGVFLLMTLGVFYKEGEPGKSGLPAGWVRGLFIAIMVIGLIVIFMTGITNEDGDTWWDASVDYLRSNWDSTAVASIGLMLLVILFVWYMTKEKGTSAKEEK